MPASRILNVTWTNINPSLFYVENYEVSFKPVEKPNDEIKMIISNSRNTVLFSDYLQNTLYLISVAAINNGGKGPYAVISYRTNNISKFSNSIAK